MHLPLKKIGLGFLLIYAALLLESFLKLWLPVRFAYPEFDVSLLGLYAVQGQPAMAALLGFWNGLLRDSLTIGPLHGWTVLFLSFACGLAVWVRDRRVGLIKKSLVFFGGLLATHTLLFFLKGAGGGETGSYPLFLSQLILPTVCLTTLSFLLGIRFFQRWLSGSGSE